MNFDIPEVPVAFFDLDDTLLSEDTNTLWIKWRLKRDPRVIPELVVALNNNHSFKKGCLTDSMIFNYYRMRALGMNARKYAEMVDRFFREKGIRYVFNDGMELIRLHKSRKIHTVIITGQEQAIAQPFFEHLGADQLICNRRITVKGRHRGFEMPNCYGNGKITMANRHLKDRGVSLSECSFYSDSVSDLPLLRMVKYPVAVNPDDVLQKIAKEKDWPVLNFS